MAAFFTPAVRLMNRLKFPQRFLLVGLIIVVPMSALLSQYIAQINLVIDFAEKEQLGLQYHAPLIAFLHDVEDYAGLVSVYVAGDDTVRAQVAPAMTDRQAAVERDILAVDTSHQQLASALNLGTQWDGIKAAWNAAKS